MCGERVERQRWRLFKRSSAHRTRAHHTPTSPHTPHQHHNCRNAPHHQQQKVENGDLNWIVPGKLAAFSGPAARPTDYVGFRAMVPEDYWDYYRRRRVGAVVRLNKKVRCLFCQRSARACFLGGGRRVARSYGVRNTLTHTHTHTHTLTHNTTQHNTTQHNTTHTNTQTTQTTTRPTSTPGLRGAALRRRRPAPPRALLPRRLVPSRRPAAALPGARRGGARRFALGRRCLPLSPPLARRCLLLASLCLSGRPPSSSRAPLSRSLHHPGSSLPLNCRRSAARSRSTARPASGAPACSSARTS